MQLQALHNEIIKIKHPVIDQTLVELGIIKKVRIAQNLAIVFLAFPFLGISIDELPVRNQVIKQIRQVIMRFGFDVKIIVKEMSNDDLRNFLLKERETWYSVWDNRLEG